jgi:pyruvate,water dikinase
VPRSLQELAKIILQDAKGKEFAAMETKSALKWLQQHTGAVGEGFKTFIETHGHRCLREFDIFCLAWELDPSIVVENLKTLVSYPATLDTKKEFTNVEDAVGKLKTPLSWKSRQIIKWVLGISRYAVEAREQSKSLLIRTVHQFRLAYRALAKKMVEEGRLPEPDLIFFLTNWELKNLLETRSPKLVARATKRKRIQPKMDQLKFPEISFGVPRPIDLTEIDSSLATTSRVEGTPVSQGVIKATARVVIDLKDATQIKSGDVLITYATDIGWSPYFPLLSGVVTEMGGLISHGAVVAREYGLPCVVGAKKATGVFKSGDIVILNGTKGYIEKVEEKKEQAANGHATN